MSTVDNIKKWMENSIVDELLIFAFFIAIVENLAQNVIKSSSDKNSMQFIIGLIAYMGVGYLLHYAYHKFPLGKLNVIWSCITIILAMLVGYIFYDEPLNKWNVLGLIFAIMAIYFVYRADQEYE